MYNDIIKLISESTTINDYGDHVIEKTERTVFCRVSSVGQSEFYQAQAVGLKPEIKFILSDYFEYHNEKELKYQPYDGEEELYKVIRTYRNNNELEIVCNKGID